MQGNYIIIWIFFEKKLQINHGYVFLPLVLHTGCSAAR